MIVVVCGSRTFKYRGIVHSTLDNLLERESTWVDAMTHTRGSQTMMVVEGGAHGADRHARDWALAHPERVGLTTCPADWERHGKAAGPIRNRSMLMLRPHMVLAFVDKPLQESRGTWNMVKIAREAGIHTRVCEVM